MYTLYNYFRSSASHRVRIALHHKKIPFTYVSVHLVNNGGEQKLPPHLARNPMAQVPTLEIPGEMEPRYLSQSIAILEYLDETHHDQPLLPADRWLRAKVREFCEIINSGIQPHQNLSPIGRMDALQAGAGRAHAKHHNEVGLSALEGMVASNSGGFCVGDSVTLADACLIPQLASARRFDVDVSVFKHLLAVERRCEALEAFVRAAPANQPDAV